MRFLFSILIKNHVYIVFLSLFIFCLSLIFKINPYHENINFNLIDNLFSNIHSAKSDLKNYFFLDKKNKELNSYLEELKNDILILEFKNDFLKSELKKNNINTYFSDSLEKKDMNMYTQELKKITGP